MTGLRMSEREKSFSKGLYCESISFEEVYFGIIFSCENEGKYMEIPESRHAFFII